MSRYPHGDAHLGRPDLESRRRIAAMTAVLLAAVPLGAVAHAAVSQVAVVVTGWSGHGDMAARSVTAAGGRVTRTLPVVDGVAATVPADRIAGLRGAPGVRSVTPDGPVQVLPGDPDPQSGRGGPVRAPALVTTSAYQPATDVGSIFNTTQITGAQSYWKAGYTGMGVDVAVIDSGLVPVNGLHATGKVLTGPDLSWESQAPNLAHLDTFGHGTFMSGLIAGRDDAAVAGAYAGDSTDFIGMAPDARLVSVKVADSHGNADVSQVLAGIDWVVEHRADPGLHIRVVNMSFGTNSYQSYLYDPLTFAAETAWHDGIVVVASAGNSGWKTGLNDPADDPYLIAVGAADSRGTLSTSDDVVASFSAGGDGTRNPDLVAPGAHLESLRDPGSFIDATYPGGLITSRFFRGSGTSEAAAVVAGAAALVLSQRPSASPDQVKTLLTSTATPLAGQPAAMQGAGELNLARTLTAATPLLATQLYVSALGTGTVESARGAIHVSHAGTALTGELDIRDRGLSTANLAQWLLNGVAWVGGSFNGVVWTAQGWAGSTWPTAAWSGTTWAGDAWSSNTWSSNTWSSNTWSSNTWSSNTWSSNTWSSNTWSSNTWSSAGWS